VFHFVANLRKSTFYRGRGNDRFGAYLLSVDYMRSRQALARRVLTEGRVLCADNGNVDLIRALVAEFRGRADALTERVRAAEKQLGRRVRPGELTGPLQSEFRALAHALREASVARTGEAHARSAVAAQALMSPSYAVGMEDLTMAAMIALGVESEYSSLPTEFYAGCVERAAGFYRATQDGAFGEAPKVVLAGMHAVDLDTARLAGAEAAAVGAAGIASGVAGALMDRSWVDFRVDDGAVIEFERNVPRPYVRVAEICAGMHEGFVAQSGRRPAFHALGLGTPILLPLLARLGDGTTFTAVDSTAPLVDAWTSPTISLYVRDPAPLKLKAHRILEHWLDDDGLAWACPCPYCQGFARRFPPDIAAARAHWVATGRPRLSRADIHRTSVYPQWVPLLGYANNGALRSDAAMARVGHNHWVIQRLEHEIRQQSSEPARLEEWVESVVEQYLASYAHTSWKRAVSVAWEITNRSAKRTSAASPSPLF